MRTKATLVPDVLCRVWIATPTSASPDLLSAAERRRWSAFALVEDRDRFVTGVRLGRLALRQLTGADHRLVRRCRGCGSTEHGPIAPPPPLDGVWSMSLSHSGDKVVVAAAPVGWPVGVDVEVVRGRHGDIAGMFLTDAEIARHRGHRDPARSVAVRWVRKEAVLKARRVGLTGSLTGFEVSEPDEPAAVLANSSDPIVLADLDVGADHVGCVAVIGTGRLRVIQIDADRDESAEIVDHPSK